MVNSCPGAVCLFGLSKTRLCNDVERGEIMTLCRKRPRSVVSTHRLNSRERAVPEASFGHFNRYSAQVFQSRRVL